MKTVEQIVNEQFMMNHTVGFQKMSIIEVMKEYARQVAEQALKDAVENAMIERITEGDKSTICFGSNYQAFEGWNETETIISVNKQSILQTEIKTP